MKISTKISSTKCQATRLAFGHCLPVPSTVLLALGSQTQKAAVIMASSARGGSTKQQIWHLATVCQCQALY